MLLLLLVVGRAISVLNQARQNRNYINAIIKGDVPAVNNALDAGADPNARLSVLHPVPFWEALFRGPGAKDLESPTAILVASGWHTEKATFATKVPDNVNLVKAIVQHGGNIDIKDKMGETPFLLAAWWNCDNTFEYLLDSGANINASDNYGLTAWALSAHHLSRLKMLIEHGQDVNTQRANGETALMSSSLSLNTECIKYLLQNHAKTNIKNKEGLTALDCVLMRRDLVTGNWILKHGPHPVRH